MKYHPKPYAGVASIILGALSIGACILSFFSKIETTKIMLAVAGVILGYVGYRLGRDIVEQAVLLENSELSIPVSQRRFGWIGMRVSRTVFLILEVLIFVSAIAYLVFAVISEYQKRHPFFSQCDLLPPKGVECPSLNPKFLPV
jgi:hypothetical protein